MPLFVCEKCGCIDNTACSGNNYWIRNSNEDYFFDDIVSLWFTSQIAAPSYPRHLYQELLAPGATVWNGYCGLEPDEVDQKTTLWTMEVARVDSAHANRLIILPD